MPNCIPQKLFLFLLSLSLYSSHCKYLLSYSIPLWLDRTEGFLPTIERAFLIPFLSFRDLVASLSLSFSLTLFSPHPNLEEGGYIFPAPKSRLPPSSCHLTFSRVCVRACDRLRSLFIPKYSTHFEVFPFSFLWMATILSREERKKRHRVIKWEVRPRERERNWDTFFIQIGAFLQWLNGDDRAEKSPNKILSLNLRTS